MYGDKKVAWKIKNVGIHTNSELELRFKSKRLLVHTRLDLKNILF